MKTKMSVALLALLTTAVIAQGPGAANETVPQSIDLAAARRLVDAAEKAAKASNAKVGIAVVDANGDLVLHERLDGAAARGIQPHLDTC